MASEKFMAEDEEDLQSKNLALQTKLSFCHFLSNNCFMDRLLYVRVRMRSSSSSLKLSSQIQTQF